MASVVNSIFKTFSSGVSALTGLITPKAPDVPEAPAAAAAAGPANPDIENRTEQFATREQTLRRQAAAAGVTRSDNEVDLLGYSSPKKRTAGRAILG